MSRGFLSLDLLRHRQVVLLLAKQVRGVGAVSAWLPGDMLRFRAPGRPRRNRPVALTPIRSVNHQLDCGLNGSRYLLSCATCRSTVELYGS